MARSCPPHLDAGDLGGQINPQRQYHPPRLLSHPGLPPFPSCLDRPNMHHPIIALTKTPLRACTMRRILIHRLANSPMHVSILRCNEVCNRPLDPHRHSSVSAHCDRVIPPTRVPPYHNGKPQPSPCLSIYPPSPFMIPSQIHGQAADCLATRSSCHLSNPSHHPVTSAILPMHYHPYRPSRICAAYRRRILPPSSND